jgi:hypothetical protein
MSQENLTNFVIDQEIKMNVFINNLLESNELIDDLDQTLDVKFLKTIEDIDMRENLRLKIFTNLVKNIKYINLVKETIDPYCQFKNIMLCDKYNSLIFENGLFDILVNRVFNGDMKKLYNKLIDDKQREFHVYSFISELICNSITNEKIRQKLENENIIEKCFDIIFDESNSDINIYYFLRYKTI